MVCSGSGSDNSSLYSSVESCVGAVGAGGSVVAVSATGSGTSVVYAGVVEGADDVGSSSPNRSRFSTDSSR